MPICYVVCRITEDVPEPEILCVFRDQSQSRQFAVKQLLNADQRIVTITSWLQDDQQQDRQQDHQHQHQQRQQRRYQQQRQRRLDSIIE